jgi:hypothetical protein
MGHETASESRQEPVPSRVERFVDRPRDNENPCIMTHRKSPLCECIAGGPA